MKACADRADSLLLDVHGEMPQEERRQWEAHLHNCQGCAAERSRLLALLHLIREDMKAPQLSPEAGERLVRSISSAVREECKMGWWERVRTRWLPVRPVPALVAASLMVMLVGWFGLRETAQHTLGTSTVAVDPEDRILVEEMDLLEQLDLLEEMDIVQNLVRVVDNREAVL